MAFIVQTAPTRWELRESHRTERGPRSRTLATFGRLTDEVLERAAERAQGSFDRDEVVAAARRSSVPVAGAPAEHAARTLIAQLAAGASLSPSLAGVLATLLAPAEAAPVSEAAMAAAAWADASPALHGEALVDLLHLADALPAPKAERPANFPVLHSATA